MIDLRLPFCGIQYDYLFVVVESLVFNVPSKDVYHACGSCQIVVHLLRYRAMKNYAIPIAPRQEPVSELLIFAVLIAMERYSNYNVIKAGYCKDDQ